MKKSTAGKGFWDDYNQKQRKIMEEQDKANNGKTYSPIKPGNRKPGTPVKPAKKKK